MKRVNPFRRGKSLAVAAVLAALLTTSVADGLVAASLAKADELSDAISIRSPGARAAGALANAKARLGGAPEHRAKPRPRKTATHKPDGTVERIAKSLQRPVLERADPIDLNDDQLAPQLRGSAPSSPGQNATFAAPLAPSGSVAGGGGGVLPGAGSGGDGDRELVPGAELARPVMPSAIPEPSTWLLLITGFALTACRLRKVTAAGNRACPQRVESGRLQSVTPNERNGRATLPSMRKS
jgi:hypothetical protein